MALVWLSSDMMGWVKVCQTKLEAHLGRKPSVDEVLRELIDISLFSTPNRFKYPPENSQPKGGE